MFWRRLLWIGSVALVGVLIGALTSSATFREALARRAVDEAMALARSRFGVRVSSGSSELIGFSTIRLEDVRVAYGSVEAPPLDLRVTTVDVGLRLSGLLRGRPEIDSIKLLKPQVILASQLISQLRDRNSVTDGQKAGNVPGLGSKTSSRWRKLPEFEVVAGQLSVQGYEQQVGAANLRLTPLIEGSRAGLRWRVVGSGELSGRVRGRCRAEGWIEPVEGLGARIGVVCPTPLSTGLPVAGLEMQVSGMDLRAGMFSNEPGIRLQLDPWSLVMPRGQDALDLSLARGKAVLSFESLRKVKVDFQLMPSVGSGKASVRGEVDPVAQTGSVDLQAIGLDLSTLSSKEALPFQIHGGLLEADVALDLRADTQEADVIGSLVVRDLNIQHPWLAAEPVDGVQLRLDLDSMLRLRERRVEVFRNIWQINGLPVEVDGSFDAGEARRVRGTLHVAAQPGSVLAAAFPAVLTPRITPLRMSGSWSGKVQMDVDFKLPDDLQLEVELDLDELKVEQLGRVRLNSVLGPYKRKYVDPESEELKSVTTGPGSPGFVPIERIPWELQLALITQEDGGFFKHEGFSLFHVRGALKRDIKEGRLARGASTISMQTVKNVFLTHEKTLARKLQEVLLTWQMEKQLGKTDILETYLNVIEWGPRIFGIGAAAEAFFGKSPDELDPLECLYLATMVPAPRFYHAEFASGEMGRKHRRRIQRLMALMVKRGHLEEDEFQAAQALDFRPTLLPPKENVKEL